MQFFLRAGIAVPVVYFGAQILAAPFYPGYSFLNRDASTLGSDGSSIPLIFNAGVVIAGLIKWLATWGFLRKFQTLGVGSIVTWVTVAALFCSGLGSINAGIFPLPDPRHNQSLPAILGLFGLLLPLLLPAALWSVATKT